MQATLQRAKRPLDALIVSTGGNDVGFSRVLTDLTGDQLTILGMWSTGKSLRDVIDECGRKLEELPTLTIVMRWFRVEADSDRIAALT